MTIATVRQKIQDGGYTNSEPFQDFSIDPIKHRRWYDRERACIEMFREDAIAATNLENNPKADQAFNVAWGWGHGGLCVVLACLEDLSSLVN